MHIVKILYRLFLYDVQQSYKNESRREHCLNPVSCTVCILNLIQFLEVVFFFSPTKGTSNRKCPSSVYTIHKFFQRLLNLSVKNIFFSSANVKIKCVQYMSNRLKRHLLPNLCSRIQHLLVYSNQLFIIQLFSKGKGQSFLRISVGDVFSN